MIKETKARLHEYGGSVALQIAGNETFYLNWYLAEKLAKELTLAARQIQHSYHYPTTEIDITKG